MSSLRNYTKRNLKSSLIERIFRNFSVTNWIILINVLFFLAISLLSVAYKEIIGYIALQPSSIIQGQNLWTILTSMFMHANFSHLFVNMISLLFIGNFIEKLLGKKRFFLFYIISGIIASLFFIAIGLFTSPNSYAVGASGAIFGLGGLLAVLTPKLPVLVFFIIPMPMWLAMIVLLGVLWIISFAFGVPIGNSAHLGGLLAGLIYGFYLRNKYKNKVRLLNRLFR